MNKNKISNIDGLIKKYNSGKNSESDVRNWVISSYCVLKSIQYEGILDFEHFLMRENFWKGPTYFNQEISDNVLRGTKSHLDFAKSSLKSKVA